MTRDINVLRMWLLIVVVIAAISTTAVPVLYSRLPWRSKTAGKFFMMQAIAFAAAIDTTVLFQFWHPDILVEFWIDTVIFTAIAASTIAHVLLISRFFNKRDKP